MMCLKVSSSIHPTSAPTGIDDDMAGSDKADALIDQTGTAAFSASNPADSTRIDLL
jgi:hypothetical protein